MASESSIVRRRIFSEAVSAQEQRDARHSHDYKKQVLTPQGIGLECGCGQQIIAWQASESMAFGNYGEGR